MDLTRAGARQFILALTASAFLPVVANAAQDNAATSMPPDKWQFAVLLYGFVPQISGRVSFPIAGTGGSFTLDQGDVLNNLKLAFLGSFDAHYGRWGAFADVLYLDLGNSKSGFRDFTLPEGVPVGTSARVDLDNKAWIVTSGLEYRVVMQPDVILDSFVGARYLYMKPSIQWNITGDIGTNPPRVRTGNVERSGDKVDAVIGFKGDWKFAGADHPWALPFYADIGGGDSKLTWQVAVGIGYHLGSWEIDALYREINYHLNSSGFQDLNVKGPMLGGAYRW